MSENSDDLMARVLQGRSAERHHWDDYYRSFHAAVPSATEEYGKVLRTSQGRTSYEVLLSQLPVDARTVLDVGCGDGYFLEAVNQRLPNTTLSGIDLSAKEIARAGERLNGRNIGTLVEATALAMPFQSESFDVAVSHKVLMLIPEVEASFREIRRVLKGGGVLAFVVGDPGSSDPRMKELFERVNDIVRKSYPGFTPLNPADQRIFSASGISELLAQADLSEVSQMQFITTAELDSEQLFEQLIKRYYVGSLEDDLLTKIKVLCRSLCEHGFTYIESLRLVTAHR